VSSSLRSSRKHCTELELSPVERRRHRGGGFVLPNSLDLFMQAGFAVLANLIDPSA
jgi:hypothetical protein